MDDKQGHYTNMSYAPAHATAWRVTDRPQSGVFIETLGGVKLCRVSNGCIHFWDKKAKADVTISVEQLIKLAR